MHKCDTCQYSTEKQAMFNRHMDSAKHKKAASKNEAIYEILEFIRNYNDERTDYLTDQVLIDILRHKKHKAVVAYIQCKHYNPCYPENHNIQYYADKAIHYIKSENVWKIILPYTLCDVLYSDNKKEMIHKLDNIKEQIKLKPVYGLELPEIETFYTYLEPEVVI